MKNQAEYGPNTRRAAIRAYKYLHAMVNQHGPLIQQTYEAAKEQATRSKGTATKDPTAYRPRPQELPTVPPELTSEQLHCLSTLPDPWPLATITSIWIVLASGYRKWEDFSLPMNMFGMQKFCL